MLEATKSPNLWYVLFRENMLKKGMESLIERLSCHDEYEYEYEFYRIIMKYVYISPM